MSNLDAAGQRLLDLLVARLPMARPADPRTYISYKDVHDILGLPLQGPTYGGSLKHQGLSSLAQWTATTSKPGLTGLIVNRDSLMPGEGYFELFGKKESDFAWWRNEIERSKQFDWTPYLGKAPPAPAPRPSFKVGHPYTRKDIFALLGIADPQGGNWYTGYAQHEDDWFVFCGVGAPGRTGHDYHNHFRGDELVWFAKTATHVGQPAIQSLIKPIGSVFIFYRENDRDPFTFAGLGRPKSVEPTSPVRIVWSFANDSLLHPEILAEEIVNPEEIIEGAKKTISVNIYERDPNARRKCIEHWGCACAVCGFDFSRAYGEFGAGFIHVHHLVPLHEVGDSYRTNPIKDLRPVCPNCHAMIHRASPILTIDALRSLLRTELGPR